MSKFLSKAVELVYEGKTIEAMNHRKNIFSSYGDKEIAFDDESSKVTELNELREQFWDLNESFVTSKLAGFPSTLRFKDSERLRTLNTMREQFVTLKGKKRIDQEFLAKLQYLLTREQHVRGFCKRNLIEELSWNDLKRAKKVTRYIRRNMKGLYEMEREFFRQISSLNLISEESFLGSIWRFFKIFCIAILCFIAVILVIMAVVEIFS